MSKLFSKSGFSILEVVLVIALIAVLIGVSLPIFQTFYLKNGTNITVNTVINALRRANLLAQSIAQDSDWGVYIEDNQVTVFKGDDYSSRDPLDDEIYVYNMVVEATGLQEIIFNKVSGLPQSTGDIYLNSIINEIRTINLNQKGVIDY